MGCSKGKTPFCSAHYNINVNQIERMKIGWDSNCFAEAALHFETLTRPQDARRITKGRGICSSWSNDHCLASCGLEHGRAQLIRALNTSPIWESPSALLTHSHELCSLLYLLRNRIIYVHWIQMLQQHTLLGFCNKYDDLRDTLPAQTDHNACDCDINIWTLLLPGTLPFQPSLCICCIWEHDLIVLLNKNTAQRDIWQHFEYVWIHAEA